LLALASSNSAAEVKTTTESAIGGYQKSKDLYASLQQLTKLKGIGPATASLMLSAADPQAAPFFADEAFRWVCWAEPPKGGQGWERKIQYNAKEYKTLAEKALSVANRLDVPVIDVEKVAYVLGREQVLISQSQVSIPRAEVVSQATQTTSRESGVKKRRRADDDVPTTKRKSSRIRA
jgi:hypothetical protein